ncbi:MAG: SHOCT domain-containing protein [Pirellulales bacterium]
MEKNRSSASNFTVNNDLGGATQSKITSSENSDNDLEVLSKLKKMLDAGLIEQVEFDQKKREILDRL